MSNSDPSAIVIQSIPRMCGLFISFDSNECTRMTTRSFAFTLARREAFLNPHLPVRCLAGDGSGRLIAVEVEI